MWFVFALLSAVFAALTSILAKVGSFYVLKHIIRRTGCSPAVRKGRKPVQESIHW